MNITLDDSLFKIYLDVWANSGMTLLTRNQCNDLL